MRDTQWKERLANEMQRLGANIGRTPDLDLIPFLYRPDDSVTQLPRDEDQHNVFRVLVDGIVVRFTEESHLVRASAGFRMNVCKYYRRACETSCLTQATANR